MSTAPTTEDFKSLLRRFDQGAVNAFQGAMAVCATRTHYEISPEHLLLRLLDEATGDVTAILNAFKVDRGRVRRATLQVLDEMPSGHRARPALSPKLIEIFQSAGVMADDLGFDQIRSGLMVLALALNPGHTKVSEITPELTRIDADQLRDHFR